MGMKRVFLLGVGVGIILSGIFFQYIKTSEKREKLVSVNELLNKEKKETELFEFNEDIEKRLDNIDGIYILKDEEETEEKEKDKDKELVELKTEIKKVEEKTENNLIKEKELKTKKESMLKKEIIGSYRVQLGAFKEKENAKILVKKISELDLEIIYQDKINRVFSEEYIKKEEAVKVKEYLLGKYKMKTYIKKLN